MTSAALRSLVCTAVLVLLPTAGASASVVQHGYLPLEDGTMLSYTLTLPKAEGRFPVVLQYDPYAAGATSDPTWNDSGYAMLGVNFRGTGCSQGTFQMTRADIWGADGGEVVDWAAKQPWSDGNIAMLGFSFTGTSQMATAAYAGPALKAIMPGNVFPDLYGDISYPGGVYNALDPAWIVAGRQFVVGTAAAQQGATDPTCDANEAQALAPDDAQTLDTTLHPFRDDYWAHDPASLFRRIHLPMLGCVNWQDTTVFSRAFNEFRYDFNPDTTWLVGGDGAHTDCPISRARRVRFLDHYMKHVDNGWQQTPHVLLVHEVGSSPGRDHVPDSAGGWQSSFATWADATKAITPLTLYLHSGGRLTLSPPTVREPSDSYTYGAPSANVPGTFTDPVVPGSAVTYTTPPLTHDAEFLGSGSANLWTSSTAPDTDVQAMISEIRPDGQEEFVENGWLRLSHRKLDEKASGVLRPVHTDLQSDAEPLTADVPVLARLEIQPFDHVFRAGSAIRLSIDSPGVSLVGLPVPATNGVQHSPGMASAILLGDLPGARAYAPLPACSARLNQPCRSDTGTVPAGSLDIPERAASAGPKHVTLTLGRPRRSPSTRHARTLLVTVVTRGGSVRNAQVVLRDGAGRRIGASKRFSIGSQARAARIALTQPLRPGRYTLRATARSIDGRAVGATRRVTSSSDGVVG
jgi:putative CocE/NonD family hydrolase